MSLFAHSVNIEKLALDRSSMLLRKKKSKCTRWSKSQCRYGINKFFGSNIQLWNLNFNFKECFAIKIVHFMTLKNTLGSPVK